MAMAMAREREQAVQGKLVALVLVVLAFQTLHVAGKKTYQDDGPGGIDDRRHGNDTCSHEHYFNVGYMNATRLCDSKPIATVNGLYPGSPLYVREGDTVVIHVTNNIDHNLTIHWHGLRQLMQNWQDGPAYITQCPIQPGQSFTYNFTINDQKQGTVWWHAHITWLRATIHGSLVILPRKSNHYPFRQPRGEHTLILGEWWKGDTEAIEQVAATTGAVVTISDALTLNGQPGDLYNCSSEDTTVLKVEAGKTYLLRLINAAMNYDLYFAIADHSLVVVEADGEYTKPYASSVVLLSAGQSMNVLLRTNKKPGKYYIATSVWSSVSDTLVTFPATPATARLEYVTAPSSGSISALPKFPVYNDSQWAFNFYHSIKSLNSKGHRVTVPKKIDEDLLFTVGYGFLLCKPGDGCVLNNGTTRLGLSVNNNTFFVPKTSIAEAYYNDIKNVYTTDFPDDPKNPWNFTGPVPPANPLTQRSTRLNVLKFGANVQLVLQDTNIVFVESHPFHLHGFSFFVVGSGFGNYNASEDPKNFNLVDPPHRNTVSIPAGGWVALRWVANNPGVWFMHCHIESHATWGMEMAFLVLNGKGPKQMLPPPPSNLPKC